MTETDERARVVAEARSWLATPYRNCQDVKKIGVDCGMLLVRVFVDAGLCAPFDPRPYPPDWHFHHGEERYLGFIFDRCAEVDVAHGEVPLPGDVMVFKFGRCYSHGGIITKTDPLTLIHAYFSAGCVLEENITRNVRLNEAKRERRVFSYWKNRLK
jgi:hypothetical protein